MREITGDMWKYLERKKFVLFVTTNGSRRKDGCGVMGRGCALEAAELFPELPKILGDSIKRRGNCVSLLTNEPNLIYSFPVKHRWHEKADKKLIKEGVVRLKAMAEKAPDKRFVLPKPGCGNGKLRYEDIRPLLKCLPDNVFIIDKVQGD